MVEGIKLKILDKTLNAWYFDTFFWHETGFKIEKVVKALFCGTPAEYKDEKSGEKILVSPDMGQVLIDTTVVFREDTGWIYPEVRPFIEKLFKEADDIANAAEKRAAKKKKKKDDETIKNFMASTD